MLLILGFAIQNAHAATLDATFNTEADIAVTSNGYTATGNDVNITLSFAPEAGTALTVVNNTGLSFIDGVFSNLSQGQEVSLDHAGKTYTFVANYYGGSGNDLVLHWAANRAVAFGNNIKGQLGNGNRVAEDVMVPAGRRYRRKDHPASALRLDKGPQLEDGRRRRSAREQSDARFRLHGLAGPGL